MAISARWHRASKITPGTWTFFFFFFLKTNAFRSILAVIQTSIFPPAWDRLFLLNVALAELKSRRLTRSDCERLATPAWVKVAPIWIFSCANAGGAHHQTSIVSFKQAEKKTVVQSHSRPRKCLRKVQKATLFAWSNGRDAPNLVPGP